jgi:Phosphotransferase enzyme family
VGVGYILMEKLPGHPMNWSQATSQQKTRVFEQMVDIYNQLERIAMPLIGRPMFRNGQGTNVIVGPAFFDYDDVSTCIPCGPFSTAEKWYNAYLNHRKTMTQRGEVATSAPKDALLAFRYLQDRISTVVDHCNAGPFFLKHVDTRDANFLVDDDYTITGIIDWELSFFAPKNVAFQSPLFMFNMSDALANRLNTDEEMFAHHLEKSGRADLAQFVRNGKRSFLFEMCCASDPFSVSDFKEQLGAFWNIAESKIGTHGSWEAWHIMAQEKYSAEVSQELY